jgi:transcriptional antiterminator
MDITEFTKEKFPFAYEQARVLCEQLSHVLHKDLPDSELGYLALHLERILSSTITS